VDTASELGWAELENGDLLVAAEREGFDLMITTDQNLRYQQNLEERQVGIIVLMSTSWPRIRNKIDEVIAAIDGLPRGGYAEVPI
jgi:hypothetical protein